MLLGGDSPEWYQIIMDKITVGIRLFTLMTCTMLMVIPISHAQETYIKGIAGVNFAPEDQFVLNSLGIVLDVSQNDLGTQTDFIFGGALGARVLDHVLVEAEYTRRTRDVLVTAIPQIQPPPQTIDDDEDQSLSTNAVMANLYIEPDLDWFAVPYVGVGAGVAFQDADDAPNPIDFDNTTFAYQVMAGMSIGLTERISIGAEYRYFDAGNSTLLEAPASRIELDGGESSLLASMRFSF